MDYNIMNNLTNSLMSNSQENLNVIKSIEYLLEKFNKEHKLNYEMLKQKYKSEERNDIRLKEYIRNNRKYSF